MNENNPGIVDDINHDVGILSKIAKKMLGVAKNVQKLVGDIASGNITGGIKDGITLFKDAFQGTKEIEQGLDQLKTPHLKDFGKEISNALKKCTDVVEVFGKQIEESKDEIGNDIKNLNFSKLLTDISQLFINVTHEITVVIKGINEKSLEESKVIINESADAIRQLELNDKPIKENYERSIFNLHELDDTVKDFKDAGTHVENDNQILQQNIPINESVKNNDKGQWPISKKDQH